MEDVILMGLEMLPLDTDLEAYKTDTFVLLSIPYTISFNNCIYMCYQSWLYIYERMNVFAV